MQYDVIIIGGGPGGYSAAFEAAKYKMKTCIVEERELGGTCLNRGCIPTKTLVHTADLIREMKTVSSSGIQISDPVLDRAALNEKKEAVVGNLRDGLAKQVKAGKIDLAEGRGTIKDFHTVVVNGEELTAENIIIASGSVPSFPPVQGKDLPGVITSDDILKDIPAYDDMIIIGGGVIGCEIAGIYEAFGTKVTVIEALDHLLPSLDSELGRSLALVFKKRGIDVHCKSMVQKIEADGDRLTVTYTEKGAEKTVGGSCVLMAAGRKAFVDLFENEKPEMNRGRIVIDENGQTSIPHIYAVGDAAWGYPQLAHTASAMGVNVISHLAGEKPKRDLTCIPSGVYTSPEIGAAGITEKEAADRGIQAVSGKANTLANARSLISGSERGFVKITAEKETGILLGASLMCERATDLVQELAAGIAMKLTVEEMLKVIHGHPTYAEVIVAALEAVEKKLSA